MIAVEKWFKYASGVLDTCDQEGEGYKHAMVIVGYDDKNWIIKNSWGPDWGEGGFMRVSKMDCSVINRVIIPDVF
jgi:C1A family cysteine protease